jgi:hypothetical protein
MYSSWEGLPMSNTIRTFLLFGVTILSGAVSASASTGPPILQPLSVDPPGWAASGGSSSQTFTFQFSSEPSGHQTLSVLNVLINQALDGTYACYIAFVPNGSGGGTLPCRGYRRPDGRTGIELAMWRVIGIF